MDSIVEIAKLFIRQNKDPYDLLQILNSLDSEDFRLVRSEIKNKFSKITRTSSAGLRYHQLCEILDEIHLQKEFPISYYISKIFNLDVEN
jgi:hypothetical protein